MLQPTSLRNTIIANKLAELVSLDNYSCDSFESKQIIKSIFDNSNPLTAMHYKSLVTNTIQKIKDPYFLLKLKYIFLIHNIDIPGIDMVLSASLRHYTNSTNIKKIRSFISTHMVINHRRMVRKLSICETSHVDSCFRSGLDEILGKDYALVLENDPIVFRVGSYSEIYPTLIEDKSDYIESIIPRFHTSFILHNYLANMERSESGETDMEELILNKLRTTKLSSDVESRINNTIIQTTKNFIKFYYIEARDQSKENQFDDIIFTIDSGMIIEDDIPSNRTIYNDLEQEVGGLFSMIEAIKFLLISDMTDKRIIDSVLREVSGNTGREITMPIHNLIGDTLHVVSQDMTDITLEFRYGIINIIAHLIYTIIIEAGVKAFSDEYVTNLFINGTLGEQLNSSIDENETGKRLIKHLELTAFWSKILKVQ